MFGKSGRWLMATALVAMVGCAGNGCQGERGLLGPGGLNGKDGDDLVNGTVVSEEYFDDYQTGQWQTSETDVLPGSLFLSPSSSLRFDFRTGGVARVWRDLNVCLTCTVRVEFYVFFESTSLTAASGVQLLDGSLALMDAKLNSSNGIVNFSASHLGSYLAPVEKKQAWSHVMFEYSPGTGFAEVWFEDQLYANRLSPNPSATGDGTRKLQFYGAGSLTLGSILPRIYIDNLKISTIP